MKRFVIIVGSIVVVLGTAFAAFYLFGGMDKVRAMLAPKNQANVVAVTGKILCLPPKDTSQTNTLTCAVGVQTTDGKYYGLSGSSSDLSGATGSDKTASIKGTLTNQTDATYKMDGMLTVSSFTFSS